MNIEALAETEIKIDVSNENINDLENNLLDLNFQYRDTESLQDLFLTRERSKIKGWDFVRLRLIDGVTCVQTEKIWKEGLDGSRIRLEDEKEVPKEIFEKEAKNKFVISKERKNFVGKLEQYDTTISIDTLTINKQTYIFIEVEVLTTVEESSKVRTLIKNWINNELFHKEMAEALSIMEFLESLNIDVTKK